MRRGNSGGTDLSWYFILESGRGKRKRGAECFRGTIMYRKKENRDLSSLEILKLLLTQLMMLLGWLKKRNFRVKNLCLLLTCTPQ